MKRIVQTLLILVLFCVISPITAHADISYPEVVLTGHADFDDDSSDTWQSEINACGIDGNQTLDPSSVKVSDVVAAIRPILHVNEVGENWSSNYGLVTENDKEHGISAGILQWNGTNALKLLEKIRQRAPENAKKILGEDLYQKISEDYKKLNVQKSWDGGNAATRYVPTEQEAKLIGQLLASEDGKYVQDCEAEQYIYEYLDLGYSYGMRNAAALGYFCDIKNQCSIATAKRIVDTAADIAGSYSEITLNEIHEAAVMDEVAGDYLTRRYLTYQSIADVATKNGWTYTKTGDYRIPAATVGTATSSLEVKWLQWALNATIDAELTVDGLYGPKTEKAVMAFQTKYKADYKLTVDGKAGQQTIASLIKVLYTKDTPEDPVPEEPKEPEISLTTPTLKSVSNVSGGVKLTWRKDSNAEGYYVYRKLKGKSFEQIAAVKSKSTVTYTDQNAVSGKTYYYTVKAYKGETTSEYDKTGLSICYLQQPKSLKATVTTTGMKLSWKKVSGAGGYYVYRKVNGGSNKKIATIKSGSKLTYTDKKGANGKTYTYTVKAYKGEATSAASSGAKKKYQKFIKYKTTAVLNYRDGAGTTYKVKGTLKKGKAVYVLKGSSKKANGYTWVKVRISNKYYYVAKKYLKKV